ATVKLDEVDPVRPQTPQTFLDIERQHAPTPVVELTVGARHPIFRKQLASAHGAAFGKAPRWRAAAALGEKQKLLASSFQCSADFFLAPSIHGGGVNHVHARFGGDAKHLVHGLRGSVFKADLGGAKTEYAYAHAGSAKRARFHRLQMTHVRPLRQTAFL